MAAPSSKNKSCEGGNRGQKRPIPVCSLCIGHPEVGLQKAEAERRSQVEQPGGFPEMLLAELRSGVAQCDSRSITTSGKAHQGSAARWRSGVAARRTLP